MTRALGALVLGLALAGVAVVFDTASLYVPAVALVLVAAGSGLWVLLAAAGAGITREPGPPTVLEDAPYPIRLLVRTGLLPAPGGRLDDPLLAEPMEIAGLSSRRIRIDVRFPRRGRRTIEPGELTIADPLRLATRKVKGDGEPSELLVLPRVEPVTAPDGGGQGGAGAGADGRSSPTPLRGRMDGSAGELDLDGLRAYRIGTPASRIHWPAVARSGQMLERRLTAESDSAPLVVLDTTAPPSEEALDAAVRAAASLCVHLARRGGSALLLGGDRRPTSIGSDLAGWHALHARLALVEATTVRPPLARARRAGSVLWVSARPDPPRDLARATAGAGYLVTPGGDADPEFLVAGCAGRRVTRRTSAGSGVAA
ncbi:MAG: DUF58 domain-containing protein [Thermoleophilaceae bacterium]